MAYDSRAIANYFLELAKRDPQGISPMKLQKLIYFAHGWHLAIFGKPLIDEVIEAWPYGPVIKPIYHEFKRFGNQRINEPATPIDLNFISSDSETKELLNQVWKVYGTFSAIQLSNMTHEPNAPWDIAYNKSRVSYIDNNLIRDYFIKKASQHQNGNG